MPVHIATDLTPAQIKAYRIADNKAAEKATWDMDLLPVELGQLRDLEFDLDKLGFSENELAGLLTPHLSNGQTDPDHVPGPPETATTQPGDLWALGNHRLLCGDSANAGDVDRLIDRAPIGLVNTDPPYNVRVEPRSQNAIAAGLSSFSNSNGNSAATGELRPRDRPLANDFVSDQEFDQLLEAWFGNIARVLTPGRAFYIWGGYANCGNYPPVLKDKGLYFSQAIIWEKMHPVLTRKDFMGAHEWCQPADTMVMTPSGSSRIAALLPDDRVVSFSPRNSSLIGLRDGMRVDATQRDFRGDLYGVVAADRQTWTTGQHLWTARLAKGYEQKWCTYLMRRGTWWRVGCTKLRTTWGFGLKGRLYTEGGDEAWILGVHDAHADARIEEQLISVQHGVPTTCWKPCVGPKQRKWRHIEYFYSQLDPVDQRMRAMDMLARYRRLADCPYVRANGTRAKFGARQSVQMAACNLLAGVTEIPVSAGGQSTRWELIRAIDVQPFEGRVYSMAVDQYEHYVADGMVTHNCFYGWREGAAHEYLGPNNATDVWKVKKVSPQSMVHLTEKPVELAVRAIQYSSRPGENVLDLFGGSGSTLIACEQTNRNAFLMELDALYCDVIVERWEQFTGQRAQRYDGCGVLVTRSEPSVTLE